MIPCISNVDMALKYKNALEKIDSKTIYLITLYLTPDLTIEELKKAKQNGIIGIQLNLDFNSFD